MSIYIQLAILCVAVSGSGYMGYLAGIHSKRNASYRQGRRDGYAEADVINTRYIIGGRAAGKTAALRDAIKGHEDRIGL